jgi:hypothetical protein
MLCRNSYWYRCVFKRCESVRTATRVSTTCACSDVVGLLHIELPDLRQMSHVQMPVRRRASEHEQITHAQVAQAHVSHRDHKS